MMQKLTIGHACGVAALSFAAPAYASVDDQFTCDALGDGNYMVAISSQDSSKATAQYTLSGEYAGEGQTIVTPMQQVIAGSGARYAGLGLIFHAKGNSGILQTAAGTVNCSFVGEQTDETAAEEALNIPARSYGGKVRAGPGMDFAQIASLQEGDPVTLLANTGKAMGGYDWFMIRLASGETGYQWGGILCSDALHPPGIFGGRSQPCPVR